MGFSKKIIEECMVKSARCCCVCHKHKGLNIEVHHIIPKEQGGSDTEDNAIALCFDCHADAGHYHAKHPKGTKLSPSELKKHKKNWYRIVESKTQCNSIAICGNVIWGEDENRASIIENFVDSLSEELLNEKPFDKKYMIRHGNAYGVGKRIDSTAWRLNKRERIESMELPMDTESRSKWKEYRYKLLSPACIAIFIAGDDGVVEEFDIAKELKIICIPIGCTGIQTDKFKNHENYVSKELHEEFMKNFNNNFEKLNFNESMLNELRKKYEKIGFNDGKIDLNNETQREEVIKDVIEIINFVKE